MSAFFAMGGYAAFVWPSYGISFLAIAGMTAWTLSQWRRVRRELDLLESLKDEKR